MGDVNPKDQPSTLLSRLDFQGNMFELGLNKFLLWMLLRATWSNTHLRFSFFGSEQICRDETQQINTCNKNPDVFVMSDVSLNIQHLPGKLTCPMKINGWKMHFLLK